MSVEQAAGNGPSRQEPAHRPHPDQSALPLAGIELRQFRGPLPEPELLAEYERVHAGLAERIVRMAEEEQRHRHTVDRCDVQQPYLLARRGQWFAMVLAVLGLVLACVVSVAGSPWAGAVIAALDIGGVVTAFLYGQRRRDDELPDEHRPVA